MKTQKIKSKFKSLDIIKKYIAGQTIFRQSL
jgi:hypothetical protein